MASSRKFQASADANGKFEFSRLPAGQYKLKLSSAGFASLTVTSILVLENNTKVLPDLELQISICGSSWPRVDHFRVLPVKDRLGDLRGSVRIEEGPVWHDGAPVPGADITLICGTGNTCGTTTTDAKGDFVFQALPPGDLSIEIKHAGFYPVKVRGYSIKEGFESFYWSSYVERCPRGNCDPKRRKRSPLFICE